MPQFIDFAPYPHYPQFLVKINQSETKKEAQSTLIDSVKIFLE